MQEYVWQAQVNKHTAPELLKAWRSNSKAHPVDLYIKDKRVVHMRNWLIKVTPDGYLLDGRKSARGAKITRCATVCICPQDHAWGRCCLQPCRVQQDGPVRL